MFFPHNQIQHTRAMVRAFDVKLQALFRKAYHDT